MARYLFRAKKYTERSDTLTLGTSLSNSAIFWQKRCTAEVAEIAEKNIFYLKNLCVLGVLCGEKFSLIPALLVYAL